MQENKTYTLNMKCLNCNNEWIEEIEKGKEAPFRSVCPNCECVDGVNKGKPKEQFGTSFL